MQKSFRRTLLIIFGLFILTYLLSLLAASLANALSFKLAVFLFFSSFISVFVISMILGQALTSLLNHLLHYRKLLKLNNLTSPILLRLSKEAPGTYHHSILVADISSKAATSIGRDALLCRIGSYFHDIGKLKNPSLFIENNNHSDEQKNLSTKDSTKYAQNIISHIEEGTRLAKEVHLPEEIIDLIKQHHGTAIAKYYFQKVKEIAPIKINRKLFRYKGPKPQSKEAAILMLSDDLEARSRSNKESFEKPSDFDIFVDEVIKEKIKEKQLEDTHFSSSDLRHLKKCFSETLQTIYHSRIKYPIS